MRTTPLGEPSSRSKLGGSLFQTIIPLAERKPYHKRVGQSLTFSFAVSKQNMTNRAQPTDGQRPVQALDDTTTLRILYMDENVALGQLFQRKLANFGYQVDLAHTGNQGWQLATTNAYDILAIDYQLPMMNGLEVIRRLQAKFQHLPAIIILTRTGQEQQAIEAMRAGASDYVLKDTGARYLDLLPIVVEKVLIRRQMEQERGDMLAILRQRNEALDLLNQASHELTATLDVETVIAQIMASTIDVLGAQGCSLWLWDEAHHYLVCQAVTDREDVPPLEGVKVTAGQGVVGWVAINKQSEIVRQTTADMRFLPEIDQKINYQTQSLLAVPLQVRDEVIGVLEIVNKLTGDFNRDDLALAKTLAASAATALQNARLVETLRQRTADLEERNGELDAFAHTVAHDLQNMLARVVGFAELLKTDLTAPPGKLPREDMTKSAEMIASNGRKMSTIIEALLLLASVRETTVDMVPLNMERIVREALSRVNDWPQAERAEISQPETWPVGWGYAPWVEEVWYNYIGNALKYGGDPAVITLGAEEIDDPNDDIGDENEDTRPHIRYWVRDNGPGIAPEDQERLFTPFTKIGQKRKLGHGLGLSIVQRIVTKMGGTVGVESTAEGSTFFFTLPGD